MKYRKASALLFSGKTLPALNIQYPISRLILAGEKSIETRTYPLPDKYAEQELFFVETPGPVGNFKARIAGLIRFSGSFKYEDETSFYSDQKRHLVSSDSKWRWSKAPKWGWKIAEIVQFNTPVSNFEGRRGIVFTKKLRLP